MSTRDQMRGRLRTIIEQLITRTTDNGITWERAAMPDSYAVTIGDVRFRVRSAAGNEAAPYVLEFLGEGANVGPILTRIPAVSEEDQLVESLYNAARLSAWVNTPDPFLSVERQLGISESDED